MKLANALVAVCLLAPRVALAAEPPDANVASPSNAAKKAAFEAYLKEIQAGKTPDQLYDPRLRLTSGPGFKPVKREIIPPPPGE